MPETPAPDDEEAPTAGDPAGGSPPPSRSPDREQARQGHRDPPAQTGPSREAMSDSEARNWGAGAHLSSLIMLAWVPAVIGPLVVWLVKREDHPFVEDQAREALNFQISVLIYAIVGGIAALIFALATLGMGLFVVLPVAGLFIVVAFLLPIYAAIKASDGERYRYPFTMRLLSGSDGSVSGPTS
jgi:uncharacterized Tic20 family protein